MFDVIYNSLLMFKPKPISQFNHILFSCLLFCFLNSANAINYSDLKLNHAEQMTIFTDIVSHAKGVTLDNLSVPYDYLLTQPLMTIGLEKYYQRTPMIKVIYALRNQHRNTYSRVIIMYVDRHKNRNNPILAQKKNEAIPVELAVITVNFNELPEKIITDILHTEIPFGKLLTNHHFKTSTGERTYFTVSCNNFLRTMAHCKLNKKLYGRTNTIIRSDNKKWIAHVVEILLTI